MTRYRIKVFVVFLQVFLLIAQPTGTYAFGFGDVLSGGASLLGGVFGNVGGDIFGGADVKNIFSDFISNQLNLNPLALQNLTEGLNMMDRKGQLPGTSITFSTPNPKPGDKITASASAFGITNSGEAYYTWLLKRKDDKGYSDVTQLHKNAIKAQAAIYFDPETLEQEFNRGANMEEDNDGYRAPMGGSNGILRGKNDTAKDYCYVTDIQSGVQYELSKGGAKKSGCPEGYVPQCMVESKSLQCPVIVNNLETKEEETSGSGENSSSSESFEGLGGVRTNTVKQCLNARQDPTCDQTTRSLQCGTRPGENIYDPEKYYACSGGKCDKYDSLQDCRDGEDKDEDCTSGANLQHIKYNYSGPITIPTPFCVKKNSAGQIWMDPFSEGCGHPPGGLRGGNTSGMAGSGCMDHGDSLIIPMRCDIGESDEKGCDETFHMFSSEAAGSMNRRVEEEYGLNPFDDRTTPLARNDGELLAGVGMQEFTWVFEEGDEISVIAEGKGSTPTKHEDPSFHTVFSMPGGGCGALDGVKKGKYSETSKGKVMDFLTAEINPADCVSKKIFVTPSTSEFDTINVALSHGKDPNAAIASGLGQPLTITSSSSTQKEGTIADDRDLYAEWKAQCIKNNQEIDITNDIPELSKTQGTNLPTLSMTANFPEQCFDNEGNTSIVIEKKVNEPRQGGGSNFGQNTYTFHAYNAKDTMLQAKTTKASTNNTFEPADTICTEDIDNTLCRVMNNEVIAVTVPSGKEGMVSWTVNNQPYSCDASISSLCSNTQNTNTIIVPMRGNEGDHITIAAHIQDVDKDTNRKADLSRTFRITSPSVTIYPTSGAVPKVVGTYRNLKKQEFIDESSSALDITSPTVTLAARLYPAFLGKRPNTTYAWTVDGKPYGDTATISIAPENITKVAVRVVQEPSMDDRWAMNQTFGSSLQSTAPTTFTHAVTVLQSDYASIAASPSEGFFATVSANAPSYFLFILKMTVLMAVMLITPTVLLGMYKVRY